MSHEEFDKLVQEVEAGVGREPGALRRKVTRLALAGYAGLFASSALVMMLACFFIVPGIIWFREMFAFVIIGLLILVFGCWATLRVLWVRVTPPTGRKMTREETPALFATLDELQRALNCPPFDEVLLTEECNAAVTHRPRLGVFGWSRSYLLLGLPLLENFPSEEVRFILAHEFAHLSRGHGKSTQWIYRLRRSWELIFQNMRRTRMRGLTTKYIEKFWPRFNAHAFVLSRSHEYEADRIGAQLTSQETAANALIRIAVYGRLVHKKFWPDFWLLTQSHATPPVGVFARLQQSLKLAPEQKKQWLTEALQTTTTNADTHPCLTERLRSIELLAEKNRADWDDAMTQSSAAETLLGAAWLKIREEVEAGWQKETADEWKKENSKAGPLQQRLSHIEQVTEAMKTDTDALWDKARVIVDLQSAEAAAPLLQQLLQLNPNHMPANFQYGVYLLQQGQAEGEKYLEKALAADEELLPQMADPLHAFFRQTGQTERIRELYVRLDRFEKNIVESRKERSNVSASDTLKAQDLTESELAALKFILASEPDILAADLVQKEMKFFVKQPLFLLCLRVKPAWHRLPGSEQERAVVNRMIKAVRLPGRVMVFAPTGSFAKLSRKIKTVQGARVFEKS